MKDGGSIEITFKANITVTPLMKSLFPLNLLQPITDRFALYIYIHDIIYAFTTEWAYSLASANIVMK